MFEALGPAWSRADRVMRPHTEQHRLWTERKRFKLVEAGRRSGKTLLAKMDATIEWATTLDVPGWLGVLCAPTRDQAKQVFWNDVLELCPAWMIDRVNLSELTIESITGNRLRVVGMDAARRIEGQPVDKFWADEFADMKADTWERTMRPCLSTPGRPPGRAWLFGVPRPSAQFRTLADLARSPAGREEWGYYHWKSSDIVDAAEIASAKAGMDPLMFAQEYEASRVTFAGRAYYRFDRELHACSRVELNPEVKLAIAFDFNNAPGVAAAIQELPPSPKLKKLLGVNVAPTITSVVGEVWIPIHSNSERVANRVIELWGKHPGTIELFGDATGGAHKTTSVMGSDWELIERVLRRHFGQRLRMRVPHANPLERVRVNSMNARLRGADDVVHFQVCADKAPHVVEDFDGTVVIEGTAGELDKDTDKSMTHLTDAVGYYTFARFPAFGYSTSEPLSL